MNAPALEASTSHSWKFLCWIVLLAFGVRLYFMVARAAVIENEGAGYAQQAEELLTPKKFGRATEGGWLRWKKQSNPEDGLDLVETWFYPFLIAGTTLITHNSEIAARLVSLASGTCLVFPMYFLALRMYGRAAAIVVASLVSVHPLLVSLSVAGYTEALHLTLVMSGLYWAMRMLGAASGRSWLYAGILLGCAYLNRPESLVFPFIVVAVTVVAAFLSREGKSRKTVTSVAAFLLVFSLIASPYLVFFWKQTGTIRFEGKNLVNYTIGRRILSGMSYAEASRGIDENLNAVGPLLDQNRFATYSPYPHSLKNIAAYFFWMSSLRKTWLYFDVLPSLALGSLLFWFLAGLGLLVGPWDRTRFYRELLLLAFVAYLFVVILAVHVNFLRYVFPVVPFLLLWSSNGLVHLYEGAKTAASAIQEKRIVSPAGVGCVAAVFPALLVVASSAFGVASVGDLQMGRPARLPVKEAGLWLRAYQPGPKNIFSSSVMAYYADAYQLLFPYADSGLALRYIHKMNPDFIVIEPHSEALVPYLAEWTRQGIPDPDAQLIYNGGTRASGTIQIYRWKAAKP